MNLESQVVNLEFAKKLKELKVKQDSYFYWSYSSVNEKWEIHHFSQSFSSDYSAFTVAELGEFLPDCLYAKTASGNDRPLFMNKVDGIYSVGILNPNQTIIPRFIDNNEANTRAYMIIHLIENNLVSAEWRKEWMNE